MNPPASRLFACYIPCSKQDTSSNAVVCLHISSKAAIIDVDMASRFVIDYFGSAAPGLPSLAKSCWKNLPRLNPTGLSAMSLVSGGFRVGSG